MTPGPGAATFQRVLAEELIPWVERTFRAAPERILVGHSLSASFAVHTLLNRPELFDAYVVTSAPLWRYDGLADDIRQGFPRAAKAGAAVYVSVGQHENAQLRDGLQRFAAALRGAGADGGPAWSFADLPDEDHSSTPQRSLYAALEHGTWTTASRSSRTCPNSIARVDCRVSRRTIGAPPPASATTRRRPNHASLRSARST